jgi:hypothetical protein
VVGRDIEDDASYIFLLVCDADGLIDTKKGYLLIRGKCNLEQTANPTCEIRNVMGCLPRTVDDALYECQDFCLDISHRHLPLEIWPKAY